MRDRPQAARGAAKLRGDQLRVPLSDHRPGSASARWTDPQSLAYQGSAGAALRAVADGGGCPEITW